MCGRSRTFNNCRLSSPEPFRHIQHTRQPARPIVTLAMFLCQRIAR